MVWIEIQYNGFYLNEFFRKKKLIYLLSINFEKIKYENFWHKCCCLIYQICNMGRLDKGFFRDGRFSDRQGEGDFL